MFTEVVHPSCNSMPAYGWIAHCERLEASASTDRDRVNLNGSLEAEAHEVIALECESVNTQVSVDLLKKIDVYSRFF